MPTAAVARTADLDDVALSAVRGLLDEAFDGDFADADWQHALGGVHAMVHDEGRLVGHGSVVRRQLLHGGLGAAAAIGLSGGLSGCGSAARSLWSR